MTLKIVAINHTLKRFGLCMLVGAITICAGAGLIAFLILNGILKPNVESFGLYIVLLLAGIISSIVAGGEDKKLMVILLGVLSVFVVLILGNVFLCDDGITNIAGTLAAIIAGSALPILINIKKVDRKYRANHSKMVNLYKKQC